MSQRDYKVSADFSGAKINPDDLNAGVDAAGLSVVRTRFTRFGDDVTLHFDSEPTSDDDALLAGVISAHALKAKKAEWFLMIDGKTQILIGQGFAYEGKVFSLSLEAQSYWTNAYQSRVFFTANGDYPLHLNTIDDLDHHDLVDEADVEAAYQQAIGTVKTHLNTGTALKDQVRAASTVAEVDAIEDNR